MTVVRNGWAALKTARLWLGLALATPAAAYAQIGVLAGYNRDHIEEFLPADGFDLTAATDGFHIGIFFNVNLGPIGVRPAIIYHQVPDLVASAGEETTTFTLDLVEIPLDIRLRIPLPVLRPYLLAGPVFTFPSSSVAGIDDLLASRPIRAEFGAGLELDLGFRLWPEIRYGLALEPLMSSMIPIGETTLSGEGQPRLDTFTLRLGISF